MEFNEIKSEYVKCREQERQAIRDHLIDRGFIVSKSSRAGKGVINYTSSGRIKPYDLSNWKYIIAAKDGKKKLFLSLQAFDQDKHSHNHHDLCDRIGLYAYETYNAEDAFNKMITTNIDLPMDEAKFAELDALIDKLM